MRPASLSDRLAELARELAALDRYERRALSRRKFAIREFDLARVEAERRTRDVGAASFGGVGKPIEAAIPSFLGAGLIGPDILSFGKSSGGQTAQHFRDRGHESVAAPEHHGRADERRGGKRLADNPFSLTAAANIGRGGFGIGANARNMDEPLDGAFSGEPRELVRLLLHGQSGTSVGRSLHRDLRR